MTIEERTVVTGRGVTFRISWKAEGALLWTPFHKWDGTRRSTSCGIWVPVAEELEKGTHAKIRPLDEPRAGETPCTREGCR